MTTDHAAEIATAEARLAEAQADVEGLRATLAAEQGAAPHLATWEDGVAAARRRHPGRTRGEQAAAGTRADTVPAYDGDRSDPYTLRTTAAEYVERHGPDITTIEGARAEARRRGALLRSAGGAA